MQTSRRMSRFPSPHLVPPGGKHARPSKTLACENRDKRETSHTPFGLFLAGSSAGVAVNLSIYARRYGHLTDRRTLRGILYFLGRRKRLLAREGRVHATPEPGPPRPGMRRRDLTRRGRVLPLCTWRVHATAAAKNRHVPLHARPAGLDLWDHQPLQGSARSEFPRWTAGRGTARARKFGALWGAQQRKGPGGTGPLLG